MLEKYLCEADETVSGGAKGADSRAVEYAKKNRIKYTEFLPEYKNTLRQHRLSKTKKWITRIRLSPFGTENQRGHYRLSNMQKAPAKHVRSSVVTALKIGFRIKRLI